MNKKLIFSLSAVALLVLLGQGCQAAPEQTRVGNTPATQPAAMPEAQVDASVNAILNDAETSATVESDASADAEVFQQDSAGLDTYSQSDYEIK